MSVFKRCEAYNRGYILKKSPYHLEFYTQWMKYDVWDLLQNNPVGISIGGYRSFRIVHELIIIEGKWWVYRSSSCYFLYIDVIHLNNKLFVLFVSET